MLMSNVFKDSIHPFLTADVRLKVKLEKTGDFEGIRTSNARRFPSDFADYIGLYNYLDSLVIKKRR